jgi:hypothetical protein
MKQPFTFTVKAPGDSLLPNASEFPVTIMADSLEDAIKGLHEFAKQTGISD